MQKEKELVVFTHSYPFGHGETFFETEILYLSQNFTRVIIIPVLSKGENRREVPSNVDVLDIRKPNHWYCVWSVLMHPFISFKFIILELFESNVLILRKFKSFRFYISHLLRAFWIYSFIPKETGEDIQRVYYSYWLGIGTSALCIMKEKGECSKFISRAHGIDLYSERHKSKVVIFQYLHVSYASLIVSVSKAGADYLCTRYPLLRGKFAVSYLGVLDHGLKKARGPEKTFSIVSCSNLIPLKRVDLIVDSLSKVTADITWCHLGDGPDRDFLERNCLSLPRNVRFVFLGQLTNLEVIQFYRTRTVDVFIHLSSSEGLPVSMMEAISFGIPLLATNVGGVSEICNENTGILICSSPTPELVASVLTDLINNYGPSLSTTAREFWKINFNAEFNYNDFIKNYLDH